MAVICGITQIKGETMGAKVYGTYDQEELDRQLNLRARWPEHQSFFARWAEESAALRDRFQGHLDLAYGPTVGQKLDLFAPGDAAVGGPLLIFIHGGYWQALDKGDFTYLAPPFLDSGIWFASVNYDLAPQARLPEMVEQVRRSIAWLHHQAAQFAFDPERIFIAGHSAGGHLATMAQETDWQALDGIPPDLVKGACSISGVYDLEPIRLSYHNEILHLDETAVRDCSPLNHLSDRAAPLICAVGTTETDEFLRQQAAYVAARKARGLPVETVDLPGLNHFSAIDALSDPDHILFRRIRNLILNDG